MKKITISIVMIILLVICNQVNAQLGGLNRAVQRGVERAVEKKAEEKAEETAGKVIDDAFDKAEAERTRGEAEAEKGLNKLSDAIDEAQKNQEEADAQAAAMSAEIPSVGSASYTPSESEYAFMAMKKGLVQMFVSKDDKGKVTAQTQNTIKEITGDKNAFAIDYQSEVLDAQGRPADKNNPMILNYRVVVSDGVMYLDMKGLFGAMNGLDDVQASGSAIKIPNNLAAGQTIPDASVRMRIGFINCTAIITEGKCLSIEDVTVEAGTFRAHKVSQKNNVTVMGIRSEGTVLTWYVKGVGAVKTETYDKNNKLISVQELKSMN